MATEGQTKQTKSGHKEIDLFEEDILVQEKRIAITQSGLLKMASPRQTKGKTMISIEKRLSYLVK
jgi:hypothetical protein